MQRIARTALIAMIVSTWLATTIVATAQISGDVPPGDDTIAAVTNIVRATFSWGGHPRVYFISATTSTIQQENVDVIVRQRKDAPCTYDAALTRILARSNEKPPCHTDRDCGRDMVDDDGDLTWFRRENGGSTIELIALGRKVANIAFDRLTDQYSVSLGGGMMVQGLPNAVCDMRERLGRPRCYDNYALLGGRQPEQIKSVLESFRYIFSTACKPATLPLRPY
jgi:hypothetical protein